MPVDANERDEDRELQELLGEVRVVLPGVTVLFAFLLSLPFTARFSSLTGAQRGAFFVAFLSTAVAIVFLVGEVAYHRLRGHPYDKPQMIKTATRQTVTGVVLLGTALVAVIFLVTDVLYAGAAPASVASVVGLLAIVVWFAVPLSRRHRDGAAERSAADR